MIQGMTGFGRGVAQAPGLRVTADVRTVNHRYLDVELRGAPLGPALEARVRKAVSGGLARGKVDVLLSTELTDAAAVPLRVNRAAVHALVAALRDVGAELGLADEVSLSDIAALPWTRVVETAEQSYSAEQEAAVLEAVAGAVAAAAEVRAREGAELGADLLQRLALLRRHLGEARTLAAGAAEAHVQRLRARLAELAAGISLDEQRLAHEAALLADRADVAEELTRLDAYLARLAELVEGSGAAGKKLEFTLQEAFREANTIGSKARAFELASLVIEIKSELERMREQVANVE